MSPRVPQELADMVIDEVGYSYQRSTLAACSLTCHAWLHRSRVHIHAAVRIDPTSNLENLTKLYDRGRSHLADYVHSLSIDACDDGVPAPHSWIDKARPLLSQFTKVERLSLDAIVWADLEPETQKLLLTQYPSVSDIWASTCLPKLDSVRMEAMGWDAVDCEEVLHDNAPELRLRWLDVGDLCNAPSIVAKWALCHRKRVSIENIHFSWGCESPADLGELLRLAGSSVKTLSISLDDHVQRWTSTPGVMQSCIDLKHNTDLRTLRLVLRLDSLDFIDLSWISDIISQVSSVHLRQVSIYIEVLFYEQLQLISWKQIDAALANKRLKSLTKVDVCLLRRSMYSSSAQALDPGAVGIIQGEMPQLISRNLLHVTQQYS